jgi:Phytanoyl-CoA dioxygenase (PhyH)
MPRGSCSEPSHGNGNGGCQSSARRRFKETTLSDWTKAEFWGSVCPFLALSIDDNNGCAMQASNSGSPEPATGPSKERPPDRQNQLGVRRRDALRRNGYAAIRESFLETDELSLLQALRDGIQHMASHPDLGSIPATFVFLYDEAWDLAIKSSERVLSPSTSERNRFNFDLLAWHIGPPVANVTKDAASFTNSGQPASSGFSPHRDRQPEDVASSFHDDTGDAKFVTHWVALTEAVPENSCLFMIPRYVDPGYDRGDDDDDDGGQNDAQEDAKHASGALDNGCGPLYRALKTKESFQHIRAFPCQPGQGVVFTHRVAHWGSSRDSDTDLPARIAMSFVCSDPTFEPPYLVGSDRWVNPTAGTLERAPPFEVRLLMVCAQLLIYHQRLQLSRRTIQNCYEYCKMHEMLLETSYRHKVFVEFVGAMKESAQHDPKCTLEHGGTGPGAEQAEDVEDDDHEDDDEEEAMMEEMLNAEAEGYGEFQDDYDDLGGDDQDCDDDVVENDCSNGEEPTAKKAKR